MDLKCFEWILNLQMGSAYIALTYANILNVDIFYCMVYVHSHFLRPYMLVFPTLSAESLNARKFLN